MKLWKITHKIGETYRHLPPNTAQYRAIAQLSPPSAEPSSESPSSGSPNAEKRGFKHWLGGMVNNPNTGQLSHDKVWANVAAGVMTWQFVQANPMPSEWQWWAYGGMVGGYGLARRAIAAVQQSVEKKEKE